MCGLPKAQTFDDLANEIYDEVSYSNLQGNDRVISDPFYILYLEIELFGYSKELLQIG